jgi:hypothetical protein
MNKSTVYYLFALGIVVLLILGIGTFKIKALSDSVVKLSYRRSINVILFSEWCAIGKTKTQRKCNEQESPIGADAVSGINHYLCPDRVIRQQYTAQNGKMHRADRNNNGRQVRYPSPIKIQLTACQYGR